LLARRAACQIAQPAKAMDQPLKRRRKAGAGEFGIRNGQLDTMEEEVPRPQRSPQGRIPGDRASDRRCKARVGSFAERIECGRGETNAVGKPDQPFAGTDLWRREIRNRQGPAGFDRAEFREWRLCTWDNGDWNRRHLVCGDDEWFRLRTQW
jgi:hypothetical protein